MGLLCRFPWGWVPIRHNVAWAEAYLVPSGTLIHLAVWPQCVAKLGAAGPLFWGAGSPSNTMWPGPRPTYVPSFTLINPTVWPQYTNVKVRTGQAGQTHIQTGQTRQRCDSIGRTVFGRRLRNGSPYAVGPLSVCLYVCLSCLSCPVFNVGVLWPNGWIDQGETWHVGRPRPRRHCVRLGPSSPTQKGDRPQFSVHVQLRLQKRGPSIPSICTHCGQTARWIKMPLGKEVASAQATLC